MQTVYGGDVGRSGVASARGLARLGGVRWDRVFDAPLCGAPALAGGALVVGDAQGRVHAVDTADGRTRWTASLDGPVFPPAAVAGGVVYVGADRGAVYALDLATGRELWRVEHRDDYWESAHPAPAEFPTVVDDLLVYRSSWTVSALDRATGTRRWWADAFTEGWVSCPAVWQGLVIHAQGSTSNGNEFMSSVEAVDLSTGEQVWDFSHPENARLVSPRHPAVAGGLVYTFEVAQRFDNERDLDEVLLALDTRTGAEVLRTPVSGVDLAPAVADGVVWFTTVKRDDGDEPTGGALHRWSPGAGATHPVYELDAPAAGGPLIAGGIVHVITADGVVHAVDAATGQPHWKFDTGESAHRWTSRSGGNDGLCVADGAIFVQAGTRLLALTE